jgi:O-methyltransferase
VISRAYSMAKAKAKRMRLRSFYAQLRNYTMVDEGVFCDNLIIAEGARGVHGCVVECGVWRGGMSAGIVRILGEDREYYLFDSFKGLPPAQIIDGPAALKYQRDVESPTYYDNCSAPSTYAEAAMKLVGARRFRLMPGLFNDTLSSFKPEQGIALLRLDGDWYESTVVCLRKLFDLVVPRGIIIVDDYYTWDGCSRAVHDFLSERKAKERIRSFNSIAFIVKGEGDGRSGTNDEDSL